MGILLNIVDYHDLEKMGNSKRTQINAAKIINSVFLQFVKNNPENNFFHLFILIFYKQLNKFYKDYVR